MPSTTFSLTVLMLPIQVSLLWHFAVFIFAIVTSWSEGVLALALTNLLMLFSGAWAAIQSDRPSTALFYAVAIMITQLHEIVILSLYFHDANKYIDKSRVKFSLGMSVINHITKYLTLVFAFQHFISRGGSLRDTVSSFGNYEPISGSVRTGQDQTGGYSQYTDDPGQT